jgi:hypothetical protein
MYIIKSNIIFTIVPFFLTLKIEMNAIKPDEELIALFKNNIGLIYNDQKHFVKGFRRVLNLFT